jgi:iron(III) transport system ATP-binding protein
MTNTSGSLHLTSLSKRYGAFTAVDNIDLQIQKGEFLTLLGPSGSGKTTLLMMMAGFQDITSGDILLDGVSIAQTPAEKRNFGMVFQGYALFPHMTVQDNIAYPLSVRRRPKAEIDARVAEMLDLVRLTGFAKRLPKELSGGQQQRVALARALAPEPKLLLLDEPFSNLDIDLRERLAHELRDILKKAQITALFVTHDQMEAFALGDLIGVMHDGQLHQWDDAYQLYHRPSTRFVAEFIGHGVFAPAHVVQEDAHWLLQTPLGELDDVADDLAQCQGMADGDCEVLLRADDIVHDDEAPVKAQIVRKAFRGSEFLYTLRLDSGQHVMAHVPSHHDHHIGEWIGIRLQADHVVVFSKAA